jgi:O-antigen ligase
MVLDPVKKLLGNYVLVASILVTLFVSPWNSIDPVSLPKLMLLGILSCIAIGLSISVRSFFRNKSNRVFLILCVAFFGQLILVLMMDDADFSFKFYGTSGRSTGFFAYVCLLFILVSSAVSASRELLRTYTSVLIGAGSALALYGLLQETGNDFYTFVNVYDSNVFGTFGNPNFQSAFMGIFASVALTLIVFRRMKPLLKFPLTLMVLIAVLNMTWSSVQGYFNFVIGFIAALIVYLLSKKKSFAALGLLTGTAISALILFLGILNKGPLAEVVYKSSLQARGFYWRAAINMIIEHPFTGVGLDGFGHWYRRSRSQAAAESNADLVSDSAHNIPLDIGSGGGIPLLVLYLGFICMAFIAALKVIRRSQDFDAIFASIIAGWVAYQAQSLISINQLGLGVWGWSLTGLLIGYELNTRDKTFEEHTRAARKDPKRKEQIPALTLLVAVAAAAIGSAASLPPYLAANKYYNALQSGDGHILYETTYVKPYDKNRFLYTAQIMTDNKYDVKAIRILSDAAKVYPDSFEVWQRWSQISSATPAQIAKAKSELTRLDPFYLGLK